MAAKAKVLIYMIGLLFSTSWLLHSQDNAPPAGTQSAQRPGPEARRLAFLVGAWEEKVRYPGATPEQKSDEGTGRWLARPVMGRFLQFNYDGSGPQGPYRALGMLAYDQEARNYRMIWFDDTGSIGDYRGNFTDDNTLDLEHRGKVEGRDFRERISFTRVSASEIRTKIEQAWDSGEYRVFLEASATRTGPPPAPPPRREPPPAKPPGK